MPKTAEGKRQLRQKENEVSQEVIQLEAYYHWLDRGCPEGDDLTDWVEAERKLVESAQRNSN